jgi:hypothetical protein
MIWWPLTSIRIEGSPTDTRLPRPGHDLLTFRRQHNSTGSLAFFWNIMTTVKLRASTILTAFGDVQSDLVGKAVVLTDGKAGTVENVWLDELHGMRISIKGHDGKWPVSTIKFEQGNEKP